MRQRTHGIQSSRPTLTRGLFMVGLLAFSALVLPQAAAVPAPECDPDVAVLGEATSDCLAVVVLGHAKGRNAVTGAGSSECTSGSGIGVVGLGAVDSSCW